MYTYFEDYTYLYVKLSPIIITITIKTPYWLYGIHS